MGRLGWTSNRTTTWDDLDRRSVAWRTRTAGHALRPGRALPWPSLPFRPRPMTRKSRRRMGCPPSGVAATAQTVSRPMAPRRRTPPPMGRPGSALEPPRPRAAPARTPGTGDDTARPTSAVREGRLPPAWPASGRTPCGRRRRHPRRPCIACAPFRVCNTLPRSSCTPPWSAWRASGETLTPARRDSPVSCRPRSARSRSWHTRQVSYPRPPIRRGKGRDHSRPS